MSLQEMFDEACAFADCADMCKNVENSHFMGYGTPYIVNSAFACEVFIKLLLAKNNIIKKEHKLKNLFDDLPVNVQESIKQNVLEHYIGWRNVLGLDYLEQISNAFVDWRYGYESIGVLSCDIGFLDAFRNALREQCTNDVFGITWEEYDQWKRSIIPQ